MYNVKIYKLECPLPPFQAINIGAEDSKDKLLGGFKLRRSASSEPLSSNKTSAILMWLLAATYEAFSVTSLGLYPSIYVTAIL